jgi:FixJ family two-component response regulator
MPKLRNVVAVIDDDEDMRTSVRALLSAFGYAVEIYASGEAYLRAWPESAASRLIVDVQLAKGSGFDMVHRLREAGCKSPVIFMTALDGEMIQRRVMAAGAVALLRKPFSAADLMQAMVKSVDKL